MLELRAALKRGLACDTPAVPAIARHALLQLVQQIHDTEGKIAAFDKQILSLARENEVCRRLMTVLTIGPFAATGTEV